MYKIIIFTHGTLSKGLLNTSSLIVGEQPEIEAFSVELGCDLQDLKEQVSKSLKKAEEEFWKKVENRQMPNLILPEI